MHNPCHTEAMGLCICSQLQHLVLAGDMSTDGQWCFLVFQVNFHGLYPIDPTSFIKLHLSLAAAVLVLGCHSPLATTPCTPWKNAAATFAYLLPATAACAKG